jgi:hypothetical protein
MDNDYTFSCVDLSRGFFTDNANNLSPAIILGRVQLMGEQLVNR